MKHVWLWVEREDGATEQHFGPITRHLRDPDTQKKVLNEDRRPRPDVAFLEAVMAIFKDFDGQSARDVAMSISPEMLRDPETGGVMRELTGMFAELADRVSRRQDRARQGKMRAPWLADFELEKMTVRVRAE